MRLTKWVEFGQDVEIDISIDDITYALECLEKPLNVRAVMRLLAGCLAAITAIPDDLIVDLGTKDRNLFVELMAEQMERFVEKQEGEK